MIDHDDDDDDEIKMKNVHNNFIVRQKQKRREKIPHPFQMKFASHICIVYRQSYI